MHVAVDEFLQRCATSFIGAEQLIQAEVQKLLTEEKINLHSGLVHSVDKWQQPLKVSLSDGKIGYPRSNLALVPEIQIKPQKSCKPTLLDRFGLRAMITSTLHTLDTANFLTGGLI